MSTALSTYVFCEEYNGPHELIKDGRHRHLIYSLGHYGLSIISGPMFRIGKYDSEILLDGPYIPDEWDDIIVTYSEEETFELCERIYKFALAVQGINQPN